ncbi:hypothetical protein [Geotalea toluenoxydans]|uniref:hypothetical protein n=1 Tax=Geotalea toluenoxydans TaxID=421624 RepID=UPI0006D07E6C|nr:hypothetical protein [Geotalea toluenoxydans]
MDCNEKGTFAYHRHVLFAASRTVLVASARPGAYVSGFIGVSVPRDASVDSSQFASDGTMLNATDEVEFDLESISAALVATILDFCVLRESFHSNTRK